MNRDSTADVTRRNFVQGLGISVAAQKLNAFPADKEVKIGIVGGGFGSSFQWHFHPNCKVTAVCDIRSDRLQRLSEVYRCGATYKNFREFLKHRELDAVGVFKPLPLQFLMGIGAMRTCNHLIH